MKSYKTVFIFLFLVLVSVGIYNGFFSEKTTFVSAEEETCENCGVCKCPYSIGGAYGSTASVVNVEDRCLEDASPDQCLYETCTVIFQINQGQPSQGEEYWDIVPCRLYPAE